MKRKTFLEMLLAPFLAPFVKPVKRWYWQGLIPQQHILLLRDRQVSAVDCLTSALKAYGFESKIGLE